MMAECFADGHLRFLEGAWRDDNGDVVDVALVMHGRWLINSDGYYPYCSECKEEPKHGEMTHYCPNCGARMDGE